MQKIRRFFVRGLLRTLIGPLRGAARLIARHSARAPVVDRSLARLSASAVHVYRAFLSPYKGYVCAHAAVGGLSCSDVGVSAFMDLPFSGAVQTLEAQAGKCHAAFIAPDSDIFGQAWQHLPTFGSHGDVSFLACQGDSACCMCTPRQPIPPPPP